MSDNIRPFTPDLRWRAGHALSRYSARHLPWHTIGWRVASIGEALMRKDTSFIRDAFDFRQ